MIPVNSSNLQAVDYNPETHTLTIQFHHGSPYHYHGVPEIVFNELLRAPSKGQYHAMFIKDRYPFTK